MRTVPRMLMAVLALGALAASVLVPVSASAETEAADGAKLVMVLDASGSMAEPDAAGEPRIDAARSAIGVTVEALRDDQQVGLRVFGATVKEAEDAGACTDSQLLVPIDADNRDDLIAAAEKYAPHGQTPIGHALEEGGKDLGESGQRSILLVSDGLSNCEPDPCEVAADLAGDGIDLMINVIGFNVDAQAREQLSCIAEAGSGTYVDAADAEGLERAAASLATRAFRPFSVMGQKVEGGDSATTAPVLVAGTQYTDNFDGMVEAMYYLVERQIEGSTLAIGVSGRAPSRFTSAVYAKLYAESAPDRMCSQDHNSMSGQDSFRQVGLGVGAYSTKADDPCMKDERMILELTGFQQANERMPVEFRIQEDPFPENAGELESLETPEAGWSMSVTPDGADGEIQGGSSLNYRTAVETGSYTLDILPGEAQYFSVPVDWGQVLKTRVDIEPVKKPASAIGGMSLRIIDPQGLDITSHIHRDADGNGVFDLVSSTKPTSLASAGAPPSVASRNKMLTARSMQAGEHTVAVSLDAVEGMPLVPYTLTVEVEGEPTGVPDFGDAAPVAPEADAEDQSAEPADEDGLSLLVIGAIGAGVIVVAGLVVGLVLWSRSRSKQGGALE